MTLVRRGLLAAFVLGAGLAFAPADAGANGQIVVQPHLSGGQGRRPNNDVEYKVRDSDGNLVARGWISPGDGEGTATVDLPPGDYSVETYSDRDDGSRIGGKADATVSEGGSTGKQVEMDPLSPEEDLQEQVEDLEDRIEDLEGQVQHLEDDIAEHRRKGEDDAIEGHQEEIDRLKENIERKKRQLRRKKRELAALRRNNVADDRAPDAPHVRVPNLPTDRGQQNYPGPKKY